MPLAIRVYFQKKSSKHEHPNYMNILSADTSKSQFTQLISTPALAFK